MELIRGWHNVRPRHAGCVATIGNFDGVHLGHRAILDQLIGIGRESSLSSTLVTFEPQPQEFFAKDNAPPRLTRLREKLSVFQSTLLDRVLVLRFNDTLASMSPVELSISCWLGHWGCGTWSSVKIFALAIVVKGILTCLVRWAPSAALR